MLNQLLFKINDNGNSLKEFCKEKIIFIYPLKYSVDMEYDYITNNSQKVPCECYFNSNEADLILKFEKLNKKYNVENIKIDLLSSIKDYNCEIID